MENICESEDTFLYIMLSESGIVWPVEAFFEYMKLYIHIYESDGNENMRIRAYDIPI